MNKNRSKLAAIMLTVATASTVTLGQSIIVPATAHAGVFGSIKSAAKSVGGTVKSTASGFGSAAKAGVAGSKALVSKTYNGTVSVANKATSIGGKVVGGVTWAGGKAGAVLAKTYPAKSIAIATKGIVRNVQR